MKDVNDFVRKDWFWLSGDEITLDKAIEEYNEIVKEIKEIESKLEEYKKLIKPSDADKDYYTLSFYEKHLIYNMIKDGKFNQEGYTLSPSDFATKFGYVFDDLHDYLKLETKYNGNCVERNSLLTKGISFDFLESKVKPERCKEAGHFFIVNGKKLQCVYCGASTEGYEFTDEQFDFLLQVLKKQGKVLDGFGLFDLPLIDVIIGNQDDETISVIDHEELGRNVKIAHMMDMKVYKKKQKYIDDDERFYLINKVDEELAEINSSDSKQKDLLIEACKAVRYEVLILSGIPIVDIYESISSESELNALAKAYYNLSNYDFRLNSGYFSKHGMDMYDAISYKCYTAIPELNQKVLEMKVRDSHE